MTGGRIAEVPCVLTRVRETIHLVVRLADLAGHPPALGAAPGGGALILLVPGDTTLDFGWIGGEETDEAGAGVAAALAALLRGDVLPETSLRGARLGSRTCYDFEPAWPDWWRGSWSVRAACDPGGRDRGARTALPAGQALGIAAQLILHGDMVLA